MISAVNGIPLHDMQAEHDAIAAATTQRKADLASARLVAHFEATGALLQARLLA
ncbi:MAG: hypothetical protein Q8P60_15000 [Pseudorhodobacter sp.]|nr:hypothetical protein [Pseudorhodobacter sp.]